MSRPYAFPLGPTRFAESSTSIPPPDPKSSTCSPALNCASAVGLPHPSDAATACSGKSAVSSSAYKFDEIGSQQGIALAPPQHPPLPSPAPPLSARVSPAATRRAASPYLLFTISLMFSLAIFLASLSFNIV